VNNIRKAQRHDNTFQIAEKLSAVGKGELLVGFVPKYTLRNQDKVLQPTITQPQLRL
jgi:hypothetical protein